MNAWQAIGSAWDWDVSVVAGCAALGVGYLAATGSRLDRRTGFFIGAVVVLLFDLVSPIDVLADHYLFSVHMLQHLVLVLVVAPLLTAGCGGELGGRLLRVRWVGRVEGVLARPAVAWSCGVATMWFWHVPFFYNAALASEGLHIVEHLVLLAGAAMFWWPMFGRSAAPLQAPARLLYLFLGCLATTLLGIILTFAPPSLYPFYTHPDDVLGILGWLRGAGLSPEVDQQIGGLLMWVPGGFCYLAAMLAVFVAWHAEPEPDIEQMLKEPADERRGRYAGRLAGPAWPADAGDAAGRRRRVE